MPTAAEKGVLDGLSVGVLLLGPDGEEMHRNPRVGAVIDGTRLGDPERFRRRVASLNHRCHASGATEEESFEAAEGEHGVRLSATPLGDGGTVITFQSLGASSDVDQRVRQFVSHLTHELRTPLTSILGASDLLLSGRIGEVQERHAKLLRIVGEGTQKMASLLRELCEKYVEPEVTP